MFYSIKELKFLKVIIIIWFFTFFCFSYFGCSKNERLELLIQELQDEDADVRMKAAEELGKIKDVSALEPLINALKDEHGGVGNSAAWALGEIKNERAFEPLIGEIWVDQLIKWNAAMALVKITYEPAIDSLIDVLKFGNQTASWEANLAARWRAALTLGHMKDGRAVEPLIAALNNDNCRFFAALVLGEIGDSRAIEPLIDLLRKDNGEDDPSTPAGASKREFVSEALGKIGSDAVEPLIALSKSPNRRARESAAWALGKTKDVRAVEPIIAALKEERLWAAIRALGELKDPRAVEPLVTLLNDDKVYEEMLAREALVKIGKPSVEPLIALFTDKSPEKKNKWGAALALGEIEDSRAFETLVFALKDKDDYGLRRMVAQALGEIRNIRAVQPLIAALEDTNVEVRQKQHGHWVKFGMVEQLSHSLLQ